MNTENLNVLKQKINYPVITNVSGFTKHLNENENKNDIIMNYVKYNSIYICYPLYKFNNTNANKICIVTNYVKLVAIRDNEKQCVIDFLNDETNMHLSGIYNILCSKIPTTETETKFMLNRIYIKNIDHVIFHLPNNKVVNNKNKEIIKKCNGSIIYKKICEIYNVNPYKNKQIIYNSLELKKNNKFDFYLEAKFVLEFRIFYKIILDKPLYYIQAIAKQVEIKYNVTKKSSVIDELLNMNVFSEIKLKSILTKENKKYDNKKQK